jgi:uncharacterized delta-60 repeat protein
MSGPASVSSVSPQTLTITQGGAPVDIAIHVANAFTDEIQVDIPSLPLELSATSVTIPAGVSDATISIRASREAEQGPAGPIDVRATTAHGEQHFPLDVFVRGCPGCLDNTYADNGVANVPHGVQLLAVDASDRVIVVAATSATASIVSRVHDDGSKDPSFAELTLPGNWYAIALDASGGVYLAGKAAVAHVTSTGALDMSFTPALGNVDFYSVAVASDGSVFASGARNYQEIVVKLHPSGVLDASFGDAGVMQVPANSGSTVACDGSRLLVTSENAISRFDATGALDTTFAQGGTLSTSKLYMRNTSVIGDRYMVACDSVVAMLTRDGNFDPSFGDGGVAAARSGIMYSGSFPWWIAVEPDGKLVVAGQVLWGEANEATYVVRLNRDGSVDEPFATKGVIVTGSNAPAVGLQSDGRIVVGGAMPWWLDGNASGFLARYWN